MSCDRDMCFHNLWNDIPCEECPCYQDEQKCKRMKEAEFDELEVQARWICCPMCDRGTCNRNADDCDVKKWIEKKGSDNESSN